MMDDLLNPTNLIVAFATIGAFLTVLAFGAPMLAQDQFASRLKSVAKRREELSAQQKKRNQPAASKLRQQQGKTYMRLLVDRLKLINPANSQAIKDQLAQAGWRGQAPLVAYAFFRFVTPLVILVMTALYFFVLAKTDLSVGVRLGICGVSAFIGFYLPSMFLKNKIQKRQQAITRTFPDALDLLVICVEAGLSMEASFGRVADEIQDGGPELAEEMALTNAELAFLPDRRQALDNLAKRTGLPAVKSLVTALIQSEKYGTPVSAALRVIADENRDSRLSKAEKKAGALPAQLTVPMIAFFLPVLFIVLIGPAVLKTLDTV